jgi:hypothetical protein
MKLFDPFAQFSKAFETWQKVADDSFARTQAFYAEMDKAEAKNIERAESAIHEVAKLTKETLAYQAQLGQEWRKLSLEAIQKASEAFAPEAAAH